MMIMIVMALKIMMTTVHTITIQAKKIRHRMVSEMSVMKISMAMASKTLDE